MAFHREQGAHELSVSLVLLVVVSRSAGVNGSMHERRSIQRHTDYGMGDYWIPYGGVRISE